LRDREWLYKAKKTSIDTLAVFCEKRHYAGCYICAANWAYGVLLDAEEQSGAERNDRDLKQISHDADRFISRVDAAKCALHMRESAYIS
jgi:hypothetical protein